MATTIKTTFQLRRGNAEVWAKNNPVLAAGEPGFELDTGKLKIGNGNDTYNDLPYVGTIEAANPSFVPVVWNAENNSVTSSYTYNQVRELVDKGKDVVVKVEMSNPNTTFYLYLVSDMGTAFTFYSGVSLGEGARRVVLLWDEASIRGYQEKVVTEDDYSNNVPLQASATPSAGVSTFVSRADHVHPAELPEGATANQQLVTNRDGNVGGDDRSGGYTQKFIGDYVYSKTNDFNTFLVFCRENNYKIGDTITVVCNGVTYENVPITDNGGGGVHLEQTGVFSFGNVEYYGGGSFGGAYDVFPDGVTEVTFKNVHQVNDVLIPMKYLPTDIKAEKINVKAESMTMTVGAGLTVNSAMTVRESISCPRYYTSGEVDFRDGQHAQLSYDNSTSSLELRNDLTYLSLDRTGQLTLRCNDTINDVYDVLVKGLRAPVDDADAANKKYVDSRLFTFTITPVDGQVSPNLSATRTEMLAALDAGKTLLGYWTETRTILGTTDTIKHEFRLESVSGTGADRGLAFVNYEQFYKSTLYVNGNDTVSFVNKEQLPNPTTKTEAMTQSVGMDDDGRLWTEPGASSGGVTTLHINVTAVDDNTQQATFTADKTPSEMQQAAVTGPIWCVITFAAGIFGDNPVTYGLPPAWYLARPAFGPAEMPVHKENGNNDTRYAVHGEPDSTWVIDLVAFN